MMWMAFSADLSRDLSFLAAAERGLYIGSSCGFRGTVSEDGCLEPTDWGGDALRKNSSETRELLDDRCIFSGVWVSFPLGSEKQRESEKMEK
ncbi:hypothetical protein PVK06_028528 [Gossypium arboreum]|uniref:Uncharacterized protein n=1 Tax=Gossypium arboreum TaxID=29729 RepID=A0ABR0P3N1_GOSAR|nr:hypothetical protein PVK06_028528 [Gossypium arboreum]